MRGPDHPLDTLDRSGSSPSSTATAAGSTKADAMFRRWSIRGYAKAQGDEGLDLATLRADLAMNHLKKAEPSLAEPLLRDGIEAVSTAR